MNMKNTKCELKGVLRTLGLQFINILPGGMERQSKELPTNRSQRRHAT